nr:MAG TPA: hypothetical protein [Caudoviricetes sp.]
MYKSTAARILHYIRARTWLYARYLVYLCKNQHFK